MISLSMCNCVPPYRFPLFAKGSEKALFQYAVYLLNKDIAQVTSTARKEG